MGANDANAPHPLPRPAKVRCRKAWVVQALGTREDEPPRRRPDAAKKYSFRRTFHVVDVELILPVGVWRVARDTGFPTSQHG